ncbi:hypothetical protein SESBI_36579 [Sesbania bispinosa]|nr:hypothetical protein SESBI_36579 [Sesbania bispinosa]
MQPIELPPTAINIPTSTTEQIKLLQNVHNTTMYIQQVKGPTLPPQLTEANNILHHLMVIAQEVASSRAYDWRKVATKLGLTQDETYMDYMRQVDEEKKFYGYEDPELPTTNEEGGTQQSDLTSTKKDA